ncbi:hypothetical protein [Paraburkholderia xenovorans]
MKNGRQSFFDSLLDVCQTDPFWPEYLKRHVCTAHPKAAVHVAIFQEPFLQWVIDGKKTVESRFSRNEVAPYGAIEDGDIVLLKAVAGPVVAISRIASNWSYRLSPRTLHTIRSRFGALIGEVDESFWDARKGARFATLMSLDNVLPIQAIPYAKSDRRGWVVEKRRFAQFELDL